MNLFKSLIDIIFPPRCAHCGKIVESAHTLCAKCFDKVDFITSPYCKICGMPFKTESLTPHHLICPTCIQKKPPARFARSAVSYNDFVRSLLLLFKFCDRTDLRQIFAKWLYYAASDILKEGVDLIIPVPLSYFRLLKRRYNQSALLAGELSKKTGIKADVTNLIKVKHTKPQATLKGKARLNNIRNAYRLKFPEKIKGKRILLVDDVMTTGSTLKECTKTLLKAGAKSVDTLTVARVLMD